MSARWLWGAFAAIVGALVFGNWWVRLGVVAVLVLAVGFLVMVERWARNNPPPDEWPYILDEDRCEVEVDYEDDRCIKRGIEREGRFKLCAEHAELYRAYRN